MKRAFSIFAAVCLLAGASFGACAAKTTVADTLYNSTLATLTGTIYVTNATVITDSGGCVVAANTRVSAVLVNGAFSIALTPNLGSTPSGTYYTAEFHVSSGIYRETWVVPASGPVTLVGVRSVSPPLPTVMLAFSQINPPSPCLNLQNPTWNTATLSWTCTTPTGGITSLNTLNGATQTFATGTAGSDFGISSLGTTHTFNLPTAANGVRGLLNSADWNTFNNKQSSLGTSAATNFLHGDLSWGALIGTDIPNNAANTTGSAGSVLGAASSASQILESAANSWDVRNGTNAQDVSVYKTFTNSSNYARLHLQGNDSGSAPAVVYDCAGTGPCNSNLDVGTGTNVSGGNIRVVIAGGTVWLVNSSGHLLGNGDNGKDLGATGSGRPRSGYFATDINLESAANGAQWKHAYATELLPLSTGGATTDTVGNLLPANSIIEAVEVRITTTITTATNWSVGDATTAARFCAANSTLTAGTTSTCTVHVDQTGAAGPRQTAAAKVRITTTGTPGAGAIRITVFYRLFTPPTS